VANTTAAPVNCANVKISYSADGGTNFPVVLAASTPNNGGATVTIPSSAANASTQGRIKIEAVGNVFFDISDANLTVAAVTQAPTISSYSPTSGFENTLVTLTGTDMGSINAVFFNGVSASFTVLSNTQITAKVPTSATTGVIQVVNPAGSTSSGGNFTVLAGPPAPEILGFTPAVGRIGESIVVTGTSFTNVLSVSVGGANAPFTVNSIGQITATVPPAAGSGPIQVTTSSGTASSFSSFSLLQGDGTPILSQFTPLGGLSGTPVVITGNNFYGITGVKFNGVDASFIVDSLTQITATVPPSATTGKITVVNSFGTGISTADFQIVVLPVLISQVYGGGGNSGATYNQDYIELYNRSGTSQSLAGWSVQYASAAGTSWSSTALSGTIGAGKYYLVAMSTAGTTGSALPPPDATGGTAMAAAAAAQQKQPGCALPLQCLWMCSRRCRWRMGWALPAAASG
jgi:hypothetical protein